MGKINSLISRYKNMNGRERTQLISKISIVMNAVLSLGKILIGIFTLSIFFIISGVYSIGVGVCKGIFIIGDKKSNGVIREERKYYLGIAVVLLVTSVFYIIYMIRLFIAPSTFDYDIILSIAIALVAFVELGMAIAGLTKSNKNKDLLLSGIKSVSLASAFTAIVFTQVALLSSSGEGVDYSNFNGIAGIVFGALCVGLSLIMVIRYFSMLGKYRTEIYKEINLMKCKVCGKNNPFGAYTCLKCGQQLEYESNSDAYKYDYKIVHSKASLAEEFIYYYEKLGWKFNLENNEYAIDNVLLYFVREKKIENKELLLYKEKELDNLTKDILRLERKKTLVAFVICLIMGLLGMGAVVGGILMTIFGGGTANVISGIAVALAGLIIIGFSYPIYRLVNKRKNHEIHPLIEMKQDEIKKLIG